MDNEIITKEFFDSLKGVLAEQNQTILGKVGEVSKKVDRLDEQVVAQGESINFLMNERPINRREAARMRRRVSLRVSELLGVPHKKSDRSIEQQLRYEKYADHLFKRLYAEVPYEGHMAKSSYLDTPKKDYDSAMADIDAFVPASGMSNFYNAVDNEAIAKRIAREQGYK